MFSFRAAASPSGTTSAALAKPQPPKHDLLPLFEKALHDRLHLQRAIQKLSIEVANKPLVNKLRCAASVVEYERLPPTASKIERQQKARKLVSIFVQNGSMFHIQDLPTELTERILHATAASTARGGDAEELSVLLTRLKYFCLENLLSNERATFAVEDALQFGPNRTVVQAMSHSEFATKRSRDFSDL